MYTSPKKTYRVAAHLTEVEFKSITQQAFERSLPVSQILREGFRLWKREQEICDNVRALYNTIMQGPMDMKRFNDLPPEQQELFKEFTDNYVEVPAHMAPVRASEINDGIASIKEVLSTLKPGTWRYQTTLQLLSDLDDVKKISKIQKLWIQDEEDAE